MKLPESKFNEVVNLLKATMMSKRRNPNYGNDLDKILNYLGELTMAYGHCSELDFLKEKVWKMIGAYEHENL